MKFQLHASCESLVAAFVSASGAANAADAAIVTRAVKVTGATAAAAFGINITATTIFKSSCIYTANTYKATDQDI